MAVEKERIKARLRALFPKANLSQTRLDALAAKLSQKPEDDADDAAIDSFLTAYNDDAAMSFEELARHDDKIRTLEAKTKEKEKESNDGKQSGGNDPSAEPSDPNQTPEAKKLAELEAKYAALESRIQGQTMEQKKATLMAEGKKLGIPEFTLKLIPVTAETDVTEVLQGVNAEFSEYAKANKLKDFGKDTPPGSSGKPGEKVATEAEVKAVDL